MHQRSNLAQLNINRQVFHPQIVTAVSHLPKNTLVDPHMRRWIDIVRTSVNKGTIQVGFKR
jgi:hypothetical protein